MVSVYKVTADEAGGSCDCCAEPFVEGEYFLGDIDSCCGGCSRAVCGKCVLEAARLIQEAK